jgi:hypothetical protein
MNDLDQLVAFVTTTTILVWQWRIWRWVKGPSGWLRVIMRKFIRRAGHQDIELADIREGEV